jgi:hypothetical protein
MEKIFKKNLKYSEPNENEKVLKESSDDNYKVL